MLVGERQRNLLSIKEVLLNANNLAGNTLTPGDLDPGIYCITNIKTRSLGRCLPEAMGTRARPWYDLARVYLPDRFDVFIAKYLAVRRNQPGIELSRQRHNHPVCRIFMKLSW